MDAYDELNAWTFGPEGAPFHQHVVDAHAAQNADSQTKPITLAFALAGLYLHLERGYDGVAVRDAHQHMAAARHGWPTFALPHDRGTITAAQVLETPRPRRGAAVDAWCAGVWAAYADVQESVRALVSSIPRL